VVLASAIRGKSVLKGDGDVKEGGRNKRLAAKERNEHKEAKSREKIADLRYLRFEIPKMNQRVECWLRGPAGRWSKIAKNFTISLPIPLPGGGGVAGFGWTGFD
jgi:hypothetical protein